jgi:hypothetical protein
VTNKNYELIDTDVPWVFIPLGYDDTLRVHLWIKRWPTTEEADKTLAADCEEAITAAFEKLGLKYNTDAFGEVKMDKLRLYSGTDGIALPETCFVNAAKDIKRIQSPLRPLQKDD